MNRKNVSLFTVLILAIILCSSWGFLVHRTIAQLAIYELPKPMQAFFFTNKDSLVYGAPRPDLRRTKDESEGSKHYMDMEAFGSDAFEVVPHDFKPAVEKYTLDTLQKYGTLPYVVIEYLDKLTEAFRSKSADSIVFYAADLSHYVADAHVPLHTSINYDGQLTGQNGIHDLWETTVPEVEIMNYHLSSRHKAKYLQSPSDEIWKIIEHTFSLLPEMFEKEKEVSKNFTDATKYRWEVRWGKNRRFYTSEFAKQYSKALQSSINDQLIASSDALADFWYTAWVNAGKPDLNKLLSKKYNKQAFKAEQKAFRKNQLIKKKLLISTQKMTKD
ncbi:zinc dependent phospholipase C family protein [Niabella ginsengisoli]|uniref:Zinc dependent phospholipase C family protein n=1 Tax=Niabella ginsengisoli TaxID=522298 RepID=A0ABS9SF91_9BACT|nr:zinc dependent phospholipase C family protein [Niabella ginsengisoli]MCH5596991.1 zinc dependent phospholipase C family protein [Niabella ginsengisoli]